VEGWITLTVTDDGIGITPEKLQRIWQAFEQAADDERRGVEGMGLGLALVSHVIAAHNGHVAATSHPNHGSTFGFRLPLRNGTPLEQDKAPTVLEPDPMNATNQSIFQ
jgi:signal transduction histidine kinase